MCSRCARIMTTAATMEPPGKCRVGANLVLSAAMINAVYARPEEHPLSAHAALLAMSAIWGVNFAASKVALEQLSPLAFNALRFPMAALLLFIVLRRSGRILMPT